METEQSKLLSMEFVSLFKDFCKRNNLSRKEDLRVRGALIMLFENIMGMVLDVTPEEIEKFKDFLDTNVKIT